MENPSLVYGENRYDVQSLAEIRIRFASRQTSRAGTLEVTIVSEIEGHAYAKDSARCSGF